MNAQFLHQPFIANRIPDPADHSGLGNSYRNASTLKGFMILLIVILLGGLSQELNAQSFSATLSSNQKFAKPLPASYACGGTYGSFTSINSSSTLFSYATQSFTVSTAGNYTIEVTSSTASDPMLYIYTSFNPSSPNSNFKVGDDDSGAGLLSKIGGCGNYFNTGTYTIVVTAYSSSTTSGTVYFSISGAGTTTVLPTISTNAASSVGSSSATVGGNVSADGGATVTARGVAYGTSSNPTSGVSIGSGTGSFSTSITGLTPGTLYYARAYATNSVGTNYGPQVTFTTQNFTPPSVSTSSTTSIGQTTATLNGNVSSTGGQNVSAGFQISTNSSFSGATSVTASASMGTGNFSYAYSGLTGSTLYYVRAWATNNGGTTYGGSTSFYTDHTITYSANANGSISGTTTQYIDHNGTTTAVTAVPNSGYHFLRWSDNSTSNPRTDANITSSFSRSATFDVNSLEFTAQPGTTIAGQGISFTVRIRDAYSNTMTNSDRVITVALASNPAGGTLAGTLTATSVNGVATFSLPYIQKTGVYTVTVSATGLTSATSSSFTIIPAALSYFTVDNVVTPHEAGTFTSPRVTAYDIYDNIKTNYTGTVVFSSNNVSVTPSKPTLLPANYTFASSDNGVKTFTNQLNFKQYGTGYYIRVNDGAAQGEQTGIQVTSAPLNFYTIVANADGSGNQQDVLAGTSFTVLAKLYDVYGNHKLDFTGGLDVTFTSNANPSPLGNPPVIPSAGSRTFTNGSCTISGFTFFNAQQTPTITITETLTGSGGTTPAITIWPEALANFLVEEQPLQVHGIGGVRVSSNTSFSVKVTARDQYNNIKRDYVGHINFKSSNDAIVQFPNGLQNFTLGNAGIRTFTNAITIPTTGAYWLRVADSPDAFKTGELQNIVVGPNVQSAANSELFFTSYPSLTTYPSTPEVVAGDFINVTIRPRDAGNNLLCDCQTVSVMLNGATTHHNGALESGVPALVTIPVVDNHDGTYSASVRVADMSITNVITASVNGTVLTDQLNVVVNQPHTASLATSTISAVPGAITADESSVVTVQLRDQFLNNRSTDDGTVTLGVTNLANGIIVGVTSGSSNIEAAYTTGGKYVAAFRMNGIGLGTATIVGAFTNGGSINGSIVDNADVVVTHGVATQLAVNTQPSALGNAVAGIAFDPQPVIHINDQWGNHVTTGAGSSLVVSAIKETGNSILKGTLTATAASGVATFGNLNYELAESGVSLRFSATGVTDIVSAPFVVVHNIPDYFVINMASPGALPNLEGKYEFTAGISQDIKVTAYDTYGNLANRFTGNRVLTFSGANPSPNPGELPKVNSTNFPNATTLNFVNGEVTAALTLYKEEDALIAANHTAAYTDSYVNGNININAAGDDRLPVSVSQNTPAYFSVTIEGDLTEVTAGQAYTVTVHAFDHWNNPATFYTGDKTLKFAGAGISPAPSTSPTIGGIVLGNDVSLTFNSNGQATATMYLYKAEDGISITAAESASGGVETRAGYELDLDVNHGAATYFAVTGAPGAMTAGTTQTVTVTAYDTWNNLATGYTGDKAITFSGAVPSPDNAPAIGSAPTVTNKSASAIAFGTATTMTFVSGVATGTMALYKEEDIHIVATQGSITTPVITGYDYRLAVNVGHAAANYFAVTGTTSTMTAGASQTITVTLYDVYNNIATTYDGAHDLTFSGANVSELNNTPTLASVEFGSTTSLVFADGIASGTMTLYKAENAAIKVSNGTQNTSNSFDLEVTVNHNIAHNLAITTQPAHSTTEAIAGIAFSTQPVVKIRDIYGNLVVSDNTTVISAATGSTGTVSLFGNLTATASGGVATFTGLNYRKAEDMNILFTSGSLQNVTSGTLSVVHNVPTYLTISGASTQTAGVAQTITVRAYDAYDNLALRFDGSKALTFGGANVSPAPSTSPTVAATNFGSATTLIFTDGVAAGSMLLYKEETAYVVASHADAGYTDSYTGASNLAIAASNPNGLEVVVGQAAPAYFAISGNSTQVAGTSQELTVRAYDAFNNLATNYTGDKMLRFSGANPSLAPSTNPTVSATAFGNNTAIAFTNGVATMDMALYRDEVALIIATEITGGTAGQTDGATGITTPADNGGHVYRLTVDVSPNTASYFAVTGASTQTAGDAQTITVTAYDYWNNVALGYTGSKDLTFSGASNSPGSPKAAVSPTVAATAFGTSTSLSFTNGVATGSMILTKVETAFIKVTDGTINTSNNYDLEVAVNHAANNYFAITGSATQTAGVAQTITITMYDAYNNIATSFDGNKTLAFSGAAASFYGNNPTVNATIFGSGTTVAFANGIASTASMILTKVENATITATWDAIQTAPGLGLDVAVSHNIASNLRIDQQPSAYVRAGDALAVQPIISIRDDYGNVVTADQSTTVTASANGTAGNELYGTRTLTAANGMINFTGLNYRLMETITVSFVSSPALTTVTSNAIVVDHNATYKFLFTTVPDFIIAGGQRGAYTVKRYDAYDNLVNNVVNSDGSDNTTAERVYLFTSMNGAPVLGTFHSTLANGSVITYVDIANTATSANFWYFSNVAGEHLITGADVTPLDNPDATVINAVHNTLEVRPAALSHFIVTGVGTSVGGGFTEHYYGDVQSVTVEAIDILGNRKTNYSGTITFNLTDNLAVAGTNYPNDYTFTAGEGAGFDNGIHTFTNAILFTRPSFEHPSYPTVNEWWVTAVDMAQPSKYGSQVKIKVLPRPINVIANNQTKNYYGDTHNLGTSAFTVTSSLTNTYAYNESITSVTLTSSGTVNTATVGNYNIVPSNATGINGFNPNYYTITYVNGTLSVERRPITIATTGAQSKTYGDADPGSYGYSVTSPLGLTAWDQWSGVLTRESGENVGFYNMLISGSSLTIVQTDNPSINKAANYDISFENTNQFEITRKPITLTPVALQQKTYGDLNPTYTYTTNPAIGNLLANGHTVALTGALTRESGENVATYKILQGTIDNTLNPNYAVTFTEDVLFTINRLPITVTANTGQNKVYGQLDPTFGWTANPAIGHELANGLIVGLDGALSRESGEDVGLYAIEQNTITNTTNPNYDVTFVSKNFEITRLPIALTPNSGQKKTYGDSDPLPFTYTTVPSIGTTLDNGRQVALSGDLTREAGHVVGLYNILQGGVTNTINGNYNISYTSGVKFEIERKNITINVTAGQTKEYGDANPTYAYTTTPAVDALPFNAAFVGALVREAGENVAADYTITQGTLELGDDNNATASLDQNYNVTFNSADYTITRKPIAITVTAAQQKVYGQADPVFAFTTVPELANLPFQTASWTGTLVRETGEVVGTEYTITQGSLELVDSQNLSGGSLATNYTVTFNTADFAITRKPITITVDEGIAKTYGESDPAFTFTTSPALASLPFNAGWTGSLVRLNGNNNVSAYAITQGSLELADDNNGAASLAQNYDVTFVGNNLTINKRDITITVAAGQNKVYANSDPVFTYASTVDPLYYNGAFTGALTRASGENVATNYAIGRGTLQIVDDNNATSLDANYNMTFVPANFAITKKPITITVVAGQNKRYGFADPTSTPTAPVYFRAFEFESSVDPLPFGGDFIGTLERTGVSSSPVGTYAISRGSLNINDANNNTTSLDDNYQITFVGGNFSINERLLTLVATDQTKTYGFGPEWGSGDANYWTLGTTAFTVSSTAGDGMAYSETIGGVGFTSSGEPRDANTGTYSIAINPGSETEAGGFLKSNYDISYVPSTLTITPRTLHLSNFAADNKVYDGSATASGLGFFDDRVNNDNLSFTRTAVFDDANAGSGKTVTYTSVIISGGADQNNYVLESETSHWKTAANRTISQKALTITANSFTKYFGNTYTFMGTEFTTTQMVTGESVASASLTSAGAVNTAPINHYSIVISDPVAAVGTLLTNYNISLVNGDLNVIDPLTILGKVYYYKRFNISNGTRTDVPMQGVEVKLYHSGSGSPATTTTDSQGVYQFNLIDPATVTKVEVGTSLAWGSVSANDALAMQLKIVQSPPTYWQSPAYNVDFMNYIADINNSSTLSIQDVLGTKYRILNPSSYQFPAGNWRFYAEGSPFTPLTFETNGSASLANPTLDGNNYYPNIYARVVGDMDGDFNPNPSKELLPIQEGEALIVDNGVYFDLKVSLKDALEFAATSLLLSFDDTKVQVESLTSTLPDYEYVIEGNQIRFVWTSLTGTQMQANETLMSLSMRTIAPVSWTDQVLFLDSQSAFGDATAEMIQGVQIVAPPIENNLTGLIGFDENKLELSLHPNPAKDWVTVNYSLPANAEVKIILLDLMGVTVAELIEDELMKGTYAFRFNATHYNLDMGVYSVRMLVNSNGKTYVRNQKLVHIK